MNSVQKNHFSPAIRAFPWTLSTVVVLLAILKWANSFGWHLTGLSTYQIFPILGVLAFSIMWSHYMVGFTQQTLLKGFEPRHYFSWTGYVVLLALVLHPGLLAYQRFRDGFGLPPGSSTSYVAKSMAWVVMLGIVSLFVFLAFELHRWLNHKRWWFIIPRLGDAAMIAIFYHGLTLGSQLHGGWFKVIWWFYGITLVGVLLYTYISKLLRRNTP